MFQTRTVLFLLGATGLLIANEPQTSLRSVVNGVSFQPAPASVARGGILAVTGEELANAHTVAEGLPLPVSLEDPAVQVLVNGIAAPLYFVSPTQINAQVPWEAGPGWAEVVVRRGGSDSTAMPILVADVAPSLISSRGIERADRAERGRAGGSGRTARHWFRDARSWQPRLAPDRDRRRSGCFRGYFCWRRDCTLRSRCGSSDTRCGKRSRG